MKTAMRNLIVVVLSGTVATWTAVNAPAGLLNDTFDTPTSEDINSNLGGRQTGDNATQAWTIDRPSNLGVGSLTQVRGAITNEGLANALWIRAETDNTTFNETVAGMDVSWVTVSNYVVSFDMKKPLDNDANNHVGFGLRSVTDTDAIAQWVDDSGFLFSVRHNGAYLYHQVGDPSVTQEAGPLPKDANGFYNVSFEVDRGSNLAKDLSVGGINLGDFNLPALSTGRTDNIYFIVSKANPQSGPQHAGIDNFEIRLLVEDVTLTQVDNVNSTFFTFDSSQGVEYGVECSTGGTNWVFTGLTVTGDGGTMSVFDPTGTDTNKSYRLVISGP